MWTTMTTPGFGSSLLVLTAEAPGHKSVRVWLGVKRNSDDCNAEDMYKDVNSGNYPRRLEGFVVFHLYGSV